MKVPKSFSQRRRGGWKQEPSKPLSPAAKRRRAEWLRAHIEYLAQLLRAEFER
jgi:hypothetical protein